MVAFSSNLGNITEFMIRHGSYPNCKNVLKCVKKFNRHGRIVHGKCYKKVMLISSDCIKRKIDQNSTAVTR